LYSRWIEHINGECDIFFGKFYIFIGNRFFLKHFYPQFWQSIPPG